ncbi:Uncharacterised protein [uncultured archaeon]|nr:Uncharacterised protein [uncultured archaeon]
MAESAFSTLRTKVDGSDNFVIGSRVMKTAGATRHAERMRTVPVWALDDEKIKAYVQHRFPNMSSDKDQQQLAARTVRAIYLYYRSGLTEGQVAHELGTSVSAARQLLYRIRKGMAVPLKKVGRPKKGVMIPATDGRGDDSHITL